MKKLSIFAFLFMIVGGCQQDEITIYRFKKLPIEQLSSPDLPKSLEIQNRQCPKCDKKEYCNPTTGRCEALSNAPTTSPAPVEDKSAPKEDKTKPARKEMIGDVFMVDKVGTYDPQYDLVPTYPRY